VFPEEQLRILFIYVPQYCHETLISNLANSFREVLETMIKLGPDGYVAEIGKVSQTQLRQLTKQYNDTNFVYDKTLNVADLVWQQAKRTPHNVAASFLDLRLDYQQLTEQANKLALYLEQVGVSQGSIVGVCLPRSLDMLISLLAVSRAGATYVPIDPDYPAYRITHIVEDSGLEHIVCLSTTDLSALDASLTFVQLDHHRTTIDTMLDPAYQKV